MRTIPTGVRKSVLVRLFIGMLFVLTSACQSNPKVAIQTDSTSIPAARVEAKKPAELEPSIELQNTPTAVLLPAEDMPQAEEQAQAKSPTPVSDPLHFVFPSPQPAPVSAWRPPLYPTPWAPTPYDHFYFARPIAANEINWPLADYRYGGVFFDDVVHTGVDIPAPRGTPVLAAGPGKVTWAGYGLYAQHEDPNDPYGLAVAIKHDFGYQGETLYTIYGHMEQIFVTKGQYVEGGKQIGLVGDTGKVTGVHLHFEVRIGKNNFFGSRNPELWMSPPQGWGILVGRVMDTSGNLLESQLVNVHSYDTNQYWEVKSYGHGSTNSDPYYHENLVMGDLPAGKYEIWIAFAGTIYNQDIQIRPGLATYFTFRGKNGYKTDLPPIPGTGFTPPAATISSSP